MADSADRQDILELLDTSMLVEAGAGSGKTTSLVGRMIQYILRGDRIDNLAAVTFTRKAANELRERFQTELEKTSELPQLTNLQRSNIDFALANLDRAFIGTIHSFCGRILREYPIESGLDPNFREVTDEDWQELATNFWTRCIEGNKRENQATYNQILQLGVNPRELYRSFLEVVENSDIEFPVEEASLPSENKCRDELEKILDLIEPFVPSSIPGDGWDPMMQMCRTLQYHRRSNPRWSEIGVFCQALERWTGRELTWTQKRWNLDKVRLSELKELRLSLRDILEGEAERLVYQWRAYRYPVILRFLLDAAAEFKRYRLATAQIGFNDLLTLTARLLRESPAIRTALGERYRYLMVDEFQDTDPVQAEICFLLASPSSEGNNWNNVVPRPGSLFLVGDPKQSIYRFRRADIQVYDFAKRRLASVGKVVSLTRNFRSTPLVASLVNSHFSEVFPDEATPMQAAYAPMISDSGKSPRSTALYNHHFEVRKSDGDSLLEHDAGSIASWIKERIASGKRNPEDFLILTQKKREIPQYARELSRRNVPVITSGAPLLQEKELRELQIVLRALADPENPILIAAALEGMFFGCTPQDLFNASRTGTGFTISRALANNDSCPVTAGLITLHKWWHRSQLIPGDEIVEAILNETGLLYYAASQELGESRAGVLLHLIERLRGSDGLVGSGIADVVQHIDVMLNKSDADDTPLRAGGQRAVRVMNVHKSKGLEAPVVILAAPSSRKSFEPTFVVRRDREAATQGYLMIRNQSGNVAHPLCWESVSVDEKQFSEAETDRLLYVAVTRAAEELVVSRCTRLLQKSSYESASLWSRLASVLENMATPLKPVISVGDTRREPEVAVADIELATRNTISAVAAAREHSYAVKTVTQSAREARDVENIPVIRPEAPRPHGLGAAWGRAIHRAIEGMGRGRRGDNLRRFTAAVCSDEGLTADQTDHILTLLTSLEKSPAWQELSASDSARYELKVAMQVERTDDSPPSLIEGVIDAVYRTADSWQILDWKSDAVSPDVMEARTAQYNQQINKYQDILSALTRHNVQARLVMLDELNQNGLSPDQEVLS